MKATRIRALFGGVAAVVLAACCLLCVLALAPVAYADGATYDDVDWSRTGSITFTLATSDDAKPVADAQITLYKVATLDQTTQSFVSESGFEAWDFSDLSDADLGVQLARRAAELRLEGTAETTNSSGTLAFTDLDLGLYLLMQTGSVSGVSDIEPFVVAIPNNSDGTLVYDVNATPKTGVQGLTNVSVKKTWNDANKSSSTRPSSVTVQLLRDGAEVSTATLNAANSWSYTWESLETSDAYSVKELNVPTNYQASYSQSKTTDGVLSFTVTNSTSLPQTGLLLWPVVLLVCAGLVFLVAGAALLVSSRRHAGRAA